MKAIDISNEAWREYAWIDPVTGKERVYRIDSPKRLYIGNTTHRVADAQNVAHCVPAVGQLGCALRWTGADGSDGVTF